MSSVVVRGPLASMPVFTHLARLATFTAGHKRLLTWLVRAAIVAVPAGIFFMRRVLELIYTSIRALPPTERQLREEHLKSNPLFRYFPAVSGKIAWRELGKFPTPVHRFSIQLQDGAKRAEFWVKREDLSSEKYGGNKVRTLQYQLAACEARAEQRKDEPWAFLTFGSTGSNQVIATKTHAALVGVPESCVEALTPIPDKKEMDNTLNLLSALSLPGLQIKFGTGLGRIVSALRGSRWVYMPGGNGPLGVLGQAGAVLELADQIAAGEAPDPDGIVVAMGSNCTVTGLLLGVALARHSGSKAFRRPGFRIFGQPVHPGFASLHRFFGFLTSTSWPLTVGRGLRSTAALLASLGGPDVTREALALMREEFEVSVDNRIAGEYGAHSALSLAAAEAYAASARAEEPPDAPHLWLCGHFTGKSFALLLRRLSEDAAAAEPKRYLFWQTKSAVQPLGPLDEWKAFEDQRRQNKEMAKWAVVGGRGGTGHPAAIASQTQAARYTPGGERPVESPDDYRQLMTVVRLPA
eukprot:TRINITY_DN7296_c0_g3_i1.p1 TRINITY_DN7296_c0_g3~~TRINITY_DN7296_c0_g3_i1.p1  ORF type:complete len:538 (+),score=109.77 TRINITY_DN7296_c0_g3_i1:48-1616(+)